MFFKPRPVYLDCYTDRKDVFDLCRPQLAVQAPPSWWKRLPRFLSFINPNGVTYPLATMKTCTGFIDLMRHCISIRLWSDFAMRIEGEGNCRVAWQFSDNKSDVGGHNIAQTGNFPAQENYQHAKLMNPWFITCAEDVKFLMFGSGWDALETDDNLIIPAGILDFKTQHSCNINLFVRRGHDQKDMVLKFGDQLCMLAPLTDRPVKLRYHLVKTEDMPEKQCYPKFLGSHRFASKIRHG